MILFPKEERKQKMNKYVLDSSALLALIGNEKGGDFVADIVENSIMSSVNFCEVISKIISLGVPENEAVKIVSDLIPEVINFDEKIAVIAGKLVKQTKSFGLSLGDRACLATAQKLGLAVVTADKIWSKLKTEIDIEVIR